MRWSSPAYLLSFFLCFDLYISAFSWVLLYLLTILNFLSSLYFISSWVLSPRSIFEYVTGDLTLPTCGHLTCGYLPSVLSPRSIFFQSVTFGLTLPTRGHPTGGYLVLAGAASRLLFIFCLLSSRPVLFQLPTHYFSPLVSPLGKKGVPSRLRQIHNTLFNIYRTQYLSDRSSPFFSAWEIKSCRIQLQ